MPIAMKATHTKRATFAKKLNAYEQRIDLDINISGSDGVSPVASSPPTRRAQPTFCSNITNCTCPLHRQQQQQGQPQQQVKHLPAWAIPPPVHAAFASGPPPAQGITSSQWHAQDRAQLAANHVSPEEDADINDCYAFAAGTAPHPDEAQVPLNAFGSDISSTGSATPASSITSCAASVTSSVMPTTSSPMPATTISPPMPANFETTMVNLAISTMDSLGINVEMIEILNPCWTLAADRLSDAGNPLTDVELAEEALDWSVKCAATSSCNNYWLTEEGRAHYAGEKAKLGF